MRLKHALLFCLTLSVSYSYSAVYTTGGIITQIQGPIDDGDIDQKVLQLALVVTAGGGTAQSTGMVFDIINGASEILSAELHYTGTSPIFSTGLIATTTPSAGQLNFTSFTQNDDASGTYYYWLLINAAATVTSNTIIDCSYNSGTYGSGTPTFNTTSPPGFRFTSRTYKIGSTGAEQYSSIGAVADAIAQLIMMEQVTL